MFIAINRFLLALWIICGVFLVPMAPLQSSLTCFLFEGTIPEDEAVRAPIGPEVHGDVSDVPTEICGTPIMHVVADSARSSHMSLL